MLRTFLYRSALCAVLVTGLLASAEAQVADGLGTPKSFTAPPAQQFQGQSGVQYTFQKAGFDGGYDAANDVHRNHFQAQPLTGYGNQAPAQGYAAPAYAPPAQQQGYYAPQGVPAVAAPQPQAYAAQPAYGRPVEQPPIGLTSNNQRWHPSSPYGPADVSGAPGYQPPVDLANYVAARTTSDQTGQVHIQLDPDVLFEFSKFDIKQSTATQTIMSQVADAIRQAGRLTTLSAHTDFVDEQHFNFNLAQKRAISIRNWLITHGGIQPNMLEIEAHGEMYPVASNGSAGGRAQNRRVSITIHGASDPRIYQRQFTGDPIRTMGYRAN